MPVDCDEYARGVQAQIDNLKKSLEPLETGKIRMGERDGAGPWRDVTQEMIDRNKQGIVTYERILEAVKKRRFDDL